MENMGLTMIITNICTFAGTFMYSNLKRNKMKLDNDTLASSLWKELFELSNSLSKQKDEQISEMLKKVFDLQNQNMELTDLLSKLKVECTELKYLKCIVRMCQSRDPQTGY